MFGLTALGAEYSDGKYVGYKPGDHGDIVIEVIIEDQEISEVEILNPPKREGEYPHEPAIQLYQQFPEQVVETQSPQEVDMVSGATGSYNNFVEATEMALSIAAGDYEGNKFYGVSRDYEHGHYLLEAVIEDEEIKEINLITAQDPDSEDLVGPKEPGEYPHEPAAEAFQSFPEKALEQQSAHVDIVSGATNTSEALNKCLQQALTQAGLDPEEN